VLGKGSRRVNTVQKMSACVCKCKKDTCWNYFRKWGKGGWRRMVEEVNSCMIHLIHYKNLCKCHNVPTPITIIKEKKIKQKR
jgi:hypothetical protein